MATTSYTYFDQFSDVTVDLTPYFESINKANECTGYSYSFTNIQPIKTTLKNLFQKVDLINNFKSNIAFFTSYSVGDGESIQKVSNDFYGTMDNWWIIAIFNNITNVTNDWLMSEDQIQSMAEIMYNKEGKFSKQMYYNLLFDRNEKKRNVIILKSVFINDVVSAFRKEVEQIHIG